MKYWLDCNTRRAGKLSFKVNLGLFFTANKTSQTALCLPSRGCWHPQPLPQKSGGLAAAGELMAARDQAARYPLSVTGLITVNGWVCLYAETFFILSAAFLFSSTLLAPGPLHFQMSFPWIIQIAISFAGCFCCDLLISWISDTLFISCWYVGKNKAIEKKTEWCLLVFLLSP